MAECGKEGREWEFGGGEEESFFVAKNTREKHSGEEGKEEKGRKIER